MTDNASTQLEEDFSEEGAGRIATGLGSLPPDRLLGGVASQ